MVLNKRIINIEDYPMVLCWSEYKTTYSKLPCKCSECGNITLKTILMLDRNQNCFCKKCSRKKAKETNFKKYGVEHASQSKEIQEKTKQRNLERYGVENTSQLKSVQEKIKQTNLKKYGVEHNLQSKVVQEKIKQTNLKRYGVENPAQNKVVQEKIKQTCIERYGVIPICSEESKNKVKKTIIKKYGVEHVFQSKESKDKVKKTMIERYGNENPFQSEKIRKKIKQTFFNKYGVDHPLKSKIFQENRAEMNIKKYGVPYFCMIEKCRHGSKTISKINLRWKDLIKKEFGVESNSEFPINKTQYDLKINNILIDINPTISHNSTYSYAFFTGKTKENKPFSPTHHFDRWKLVKDNGYTLISVFDNMDNKKVLNIIRSKIGKNEIKIGARECKIKEIPQKECNLFLDEYHIQSKATGQKHCISLYYNNELVGVMTFGQPRFNKKYEWELVRLCFKSNITIQGGVSRMWNYFKTMYNPTSCICYLNLNLGGDNIHLEDFKFVKYNKPAGYWICLKTGRTITNNSLRFKGASRFIGDDDLVKYPKGMDNREIMKLEGFVEMYDCGNVVYEYQKK